MHCPRCNQPMHSRSWTHRDGHTDTRHVCRNHLCRYRWQERCDATPATVAEMRAEDPFAAAVARDARRFDAGGRGTYDPRELVPRPFDSRDFPGGRYLTTAECYGVLRERGWEIAGGPSVTPQPEIYWSADGPFVAGVDPGRDEGTVVTTTGKVGIVREPEVLGRTTGGDLVLGVPRKWLPPDANGIEWAARMPRDGDELPARESQREQFIEVVRWFARMSAAEAETLWILAARHMLTVSVSEIVAFIERELPKLREPNVTKAAMPTDWQDGEASTITWQALVEEPKPPRPVKVGDILRAPHCSMATVESVGPAGRELACLLRYESDGFGFWETAHELRNAGWTHADGAAIAVETKRREVKAGDELRSAAGAVVRALAATDGELSYTCQGWTFNVPLTHFRDCGWTFADTGEPV